MPIAYDFIAIFPLAKWPHKLTGEYEATYTFYNGPQWRGKI